MYMLINKVISPCTLGRGLVVEVKFTIHSKLSGQNNYQEFPTIFAFIVFL